MAQQLQKKFLGNDQVDGTKIKLLAGQSVRAVNSSEDTVDLIKLGATDDVVLNGYSFMTSGGLVSADRLPSYVDDVVEYANLAAFPVTGEAGKIYLALDTSSAYRWTGSIYFEVFTGAVDSVNGFTGIVVLDTDDISEGSTNLYFTAARAKSAAVADSITNGVTDVAPSQNAVFDALALKASTDLSNLASTAVNADIIPGLANVINLGSSLLPYATLYTVTVENTGGALYLKGSNVFVEGTSAAYLQLADASAAVTVDSSGVNIMSDADILIGPAAGSAAPEVQFWAGDWNNYIGFKAPATLPGDTIWTLPSADGTAGQYLKTDGAGVLSWGSIKSWGKYKKTLVAGDITAGYIDLPHEVVPNSLVAFVDRVAIHEGAADDYTLSTVSLVTRVTFLNDLVNPGQSALQSGDTVYVTYQY